MQHLEDCKSSNSSSQPTSATTAENTELGRSRSESEFLELVQLLKDRRHNSHRVRSQNLPVSIEIQLEEWIVAMSKAALGVSRAAVMEKAAQLKAIHEGRSITDVTFGHNWFDRFIQRCDGRLKMSKSTVYDIKRAKAVRLESIAAFYDLLADEIANNRILTPDRLFAFDETGFNGSISGESYNVFASSNLREEYGNKSVARGGLGKHISLLHICNAAGMALPPFIVFSGNKPGAQCRTDPA